MKMKICYPEKISLSKWRLENLAKSKKSYQENVSLRKHHKMTLIFLLMKVKLKHKVMLTKLKIRDRDSEKN